MAIENKVGLLLHRLRRGEWIWNVEIRTKRVESRRHDSHHGHELVVQSECLPHHFGVAVEPASPGVVDQHGHPRGAWLEVIGTGRSAQQGGNGETAKKVPGHKR